MVAYNRRFRRLFLKCLSVCVLALLFVGCVPTELRREQRQTRRELKQLQKDVRQLRQMIQTIANRSSSEVLRARILKLQLQLRRLEMRVSGQSGLSPLPPLRSRTHGSRERIGPLVRSMMPLNTWLHRISARNSPTLRRCRRSLKKHTLAQEGKRSIRCSASASFTRYRKDCSGLVRCLYSRIGTDIFKSKAYKGPIGPIAMFHYFQENGWVHKGRPRVGDVVFWHGTIDRDKDGRLDNDPLTHVGIVESVDEEGRVRILHTGYGRRKDAHIVYMYRAEPSLYRKRRMNFSAVDAPASPALCAPRNKRKCNTARRLYKECRRLQRKARTRRDKRYFQSRCAWRKKRVRKFCPKPVRITRRRARRKRSKYKIYNSYLVSKRTRKKALGYTTAELFAGYGTLRWCP